MRNGHINIRILINIGPIVLSLEDMGQKLFSSFCDSQKQFLPIIAKTKQDRPYNYRYANINVPIAHLLSPKWSLYDFHSSSYMNAWSEKWAWPKNGRGCEYKNWAKVYKVFKFLGEQNAEVRLDLTKKASNIPYMGIWPCTIWVGVYIGLDRALKRLDKWLYTHYTGLYTYIGAGEGCI